MIRLPWRLLDTKKADVNTDVNTATRVAMVAYALFTGDWITALMGGGNTVKLVSGSTPSRSTLLHNPSYSSGIS